jgi:C1A family cysteine protease
MRAGLPPVRDQGQRGTCLAFAVTAGHEASRPGIGIPEDLSEEALYWGCKRTDGNWTSGTSFASASTAITRWGQPLEADWPYDATRTDGVAYRSVGRPGGKGWFTSALRQVGTDLSDVRALLDAGTPVALGLVVFDTFFHPDAAGRIDEPTAGSPPRGRHAVLAVGHQPAEVPIRNSWGSGWALGGYAWIREGYVENYAGDAWIIDAGTSATGATSTATTRGAMYGTG